MPDGKLFACPSCGSSLTPEGNQVQVKCPYCGSTVTVPLELRQTPSASTSGINPISIVLNESGTSIQVANLSASQSKPINLVLGESQLAAPTDLSLSPATSRWIKIGIWAFVIIMILSFVLPLICSVFGIFAAIGGSFLSFFLK